MFSLLRRSLARTDQSAPPAFLWWTTHLQILSWAKEVCALFTLLTFLHLLLCRYIHFLTFLSLVSPSPVPPDIVHTSARPAHGCSAETLHREGDPDQRAVIHTSSSPELPISGKVVCKYALLMRKVRGDDGRITATTTGHLK